VRGSQSRNPNRHDQGKRILPESSTARHVSDTFRWKGPLASIRKHLRRDVEQPAGVRLCVRIIATITTIVIAISGPRW
jgi:hypothetical protein